MLAFYRQLTLQFLTLRAIQAVECVPKCLPGNGLSGHSANRQQILWFIWLRS